jgi:hypothetical protein
MKNLGMDIAEVIRALEYMELDLWEGNKGEKD